LDIRLVGPVHARIGGLFKRAWSFERPPIPAANSPGSTSTNLMAAEAGLDIDATHPPFLERRGFKLSPLWGSYPKVLRLNSDFGKVRGSVAYFWNFHLLTNNLLMVHLAGEKNWGTFPWFESAFLGGVPTVVGLDLWSQTGNLLRGFDLNRFAGDASAVANVELRVAIGRGDTSLPRDYGLGGVARVGGLFSSGGARG